MASPNRVSDFECFTVFDLVRTLGCSISECSAFSPVGHGVNIDVPAGIKRGAHLEHLIIVYRGSKVAPIPAQEVMAFLGRLLDLRPVDSFTGVDGELICIAVILKYARVCLESDLYLIPLPNCVEGSGLGDGECRTGRR